MSKKLYEGQVDVLKALERMSPYAPITVREMATELNIAEPTAYAHYRNLEKLGLVERDYSRGKQGAKLTEAGEVYAQKPKLPLSKRAFPFEKITQIKNETKKEEYKEPSEVKELVDLRHLFKVRVKVGEKVIEYFYQRENIGKVVDAISADEILEGEIEFLVIERLITR